MNALSLTWPARRLHTGRDLMETGLAVSLAGTTGGGGLHLPSRARLSGAVRVVADDHGNRN